MTSSIFDPAAFLDMTISAPNDTVRIPIPVGDYDAGIADVACRPWESKDKTKSGMALDIQWELSAPTVAAQLGREKLIVKQGIMLDLNEGGGIDTGKGMNVDLGKLREAVGLNSSDAFSFRMLPGRRGTVRVTHRLGENPGDIFAEIRQVVKSA